MLCTGSDTTMQCDITGIGPSLMMNKRSCASAPCRGFYQSLPPLYLLRYQTDGKNRCRQYLLSIVVPGKPDTGNIEFLAEFQRTIKASITTNHHQSVDASFFKFS